MATSIAVQSGDSPEIPGKIAGKSHGSVYDIVTERILAELEKGEVPWRKPWRTFPPANLVSKKPYRGINVFLWRSLAMVRSTGSRTVKRKPSAATSAKASTARRLSSGSSRQVRNGDGGRRDEERASLLSSATTPFSIWSRPKG